MAIVANFRIFLKPQRSAGLLDRCGLLHYGIFDEQNDIQIRTMTGR
jgi:hypothetical protein